MFRIASPTESVAATRGAAVGIVLAVAMAATRVHGAGLGAVLPDASLAVFFLAGIGLVSPLWFGAFLVEAVALDAVAIGFAHVPAVCLTWGYASLLPAYALVWGAGRAARGAHGTTDAVRIGGALLAGVTAYFVLSNFGYYFGGGFAGRLGLIGYAEAVARWLPLYLAAAAVYVAAGMGALALVGRRARRLARA